MTEEEYRQGSKYIFENCKASKLEHVNEVEGYIAANEIFKKYNWAFLHPNMIGGEIHRIKQLESENNLNSEIVFKIFSNSFFDLRSTAYFIDVHCKTNPYIAPFCQLIDQSVILCLQRDYAGAINILIPIIEGVLRQYLVNAKGYDNEKIMKSKDLLKTFDYLQENYLETYRKLYLQGHYSGHRHPEIVLDDNRIKELLKLDKEYISLWFSIFTDYLKNNLYLDTRGNAVDDNLNRHLITHLFSYEMYYSLENFLRLYHCIYFLSWAFQMGDPNVKRFPEVEEESFYYKWEAFEKISEISEQLVEVKATVYDKYKDFDKQIFLRKPIDVGVEKKFKQRRKLFSGDLKWLLSEFLKPK